MFSYPPAFLPLKRSQQYRRRDPVNADETEYMDNLFNSLCSALSEASIKKLFFDAEGPDLMILMMKSISFNDGYIIPFSRLLREKLESKSRSIKALDYAMSGPGGAPVSEAFVEALGLKPLFTAFMGKVSILRLAFSFLPPILFFDESQLNVKKQTLICPTQRTSDIYSALFLPY